MHLILDYYLTDCVKCKNSIEADGGFETKITNFGVNKQYLPDERPFILDKAKAQD